MAICSSVPRHTLLAYTLILVGGLAVGCGGGDDGDTGAEGTTATDGTGTAVETTGVGAPPTDNRDATVRTDAAGRKWFGDIPYDVWFADPTAVAANTNVVGGPAGTPNGGAPMVDPVPSDPMPMPMAGGATDWAKLVSAEVVDAEVTEIRNRLKQSLVSVASYNASYLSLSPYIHTLAMMGAIAADHPGDIRWKEHGAAIRDLAGQISALGTPMGGPRGKKAIEEPFLKIEDTFAGSPPADLEPASDVLFSDIADMGELMKRVDIGFNKRIVIEIGSEEALGSKKDLLLHEASVLAAIGTVITLEGYGFVDDDEFKAHAKGMIDGGIQAVEAAESGDFAKYEAAKTMIIKACTDCHRTYR